MAQELRYTAEGYPYYENVDLNWVDRTNPTIIDAAPNDAFETAAARVRASNKRLPVQGQVIEKPTSYIMEPDLLETQGGMRLPTDVGQSDAGFFNINTGKELPIVRRPNVWPIVNTPDGPTFAMPKVLDVVGNVMSPLAAGRVPVKAGEMVLGSGAVRTMQEVEQLKNIEVKYNQGLYQFFDKAKNEFTTVDGQAGFKNKEQAEKILYSDTRNQVASAVGHGLEKSNQPFYSGLERAVDNAKLGKGSADQWLGYLRNQPGVKPEELSYVLNELPAGPIGKEQLKELVKANKVSLNEKVLGGYDSSKLDEVKYRKDLNELSNGYYDQLGASEQARIRTLALEKQKLTPTKYHSYQLPGGERYKEMLLSLPAQRAKVEYKIIPNKDGINFDVIRNIDGVKEDYLKAVPRNEAEDAAKYGNTMDTSANRYSANTYKSSHWDEPNVLAHVRMNDRIVDGKKTLHIEEIQSDWHQAGRKQGYKLSEKQKSELENIDNKLMKGLDESDIGNPDIDAVLKTAVDKKVITADEAKNYKDYSKGENSNIPDAPFKKNWDELALKRMLHKAANEGYEGISWTPGEAQAARYDLSKQIQQIRGYKDANGKYWIKADRKGYPENDNIIQKSNLSEQELVETIGKEAAEKFIDKIKQNENVGKDRVKKAFIRLENLDLKVGGEGMKTFYDKMLVDRANNLAKKYGSKVEQKEIQTAKENKLLQKLKENGYDENSDIQQILSATGGRKPSWLTNEELDLIEKGEHLDFKGIQKQPIHYLPITPELRAKAKQGYPLFSSSPITVPVDHDPFNRKKYKLTPVPYNPFGE